ncbi:MAG TPA: hypothetical protein VMF62_09140 [Acetobacteraceae bacterium]|jgi:hypothetical protein|nr:hypothetical protein [Acetobacteraceae bacterium]
MPRLLAALYGSAALVLAGTPVALACATPSEQAMFDVAGLKSELMVTALSCDADSQYNAFVVRYQGILQADDSELQTYFVHTYGRAGQAMHDAYVTNVANKMSEVGIAEGNGFCRRHLAVFAEALALASPSELAMFAASRGYVQPVAPEGCTVLAADPPQLAARP